MEEKLESMIEAPDKVTELQLELEIRGERDELRPLIVMEEKDTELILANDINGCDSPPAIDERLPDELDDTARPATVRLVGILEASKNRRLLDPPPDIDTLLIVRVPAEVILTRLFISTPTPLTEFGAESINDI